MRVESFICGGGLGALLVGGFAQGLNVPDVLVGTAVAVGFAAGAVLMYQVKLIRLRGQLRIHLEKLARKQRLPMCLNCGYDHEGLVSDTCPECGMRLRPADGTDEEEEKGM